MSTDKELRVLVEGLLQQLSYTNTHLSDVAEKLATGVMNHVLDSGTRVFDATGQITFQWATTCGAMEIANASASRTVTIIASGPSGEPAAGTGVHKVAPGIQRVVNLFSRVVTVYGTAGDTIGYQAWTVGALPGVSTRTFAVDGGVA